MVAFVVDPHAAVATARTEDLQKEWQQCRDILGRFDGTLLDLRKYGFGLASTLLTATGVLGGVANLLPKPDNGSPGFTVPVATIAALVVVDMALIVALFVADRYYTVLQWAAGNRARRLERDLGLAVTAEMLRWARHLKTWRRVGLIQYMSFILVAAALGAAVMLGDARPSLNGHLPADLMYLAGIISLIFIFYLHRKALAELDALDCEYPPVVDTTIATVRLGQPQLVGAQSQLEQEVQANADLPQNCRVLAIVKPTNQAGLALTACRATGVRTLRITFTNDSTVSVTPATEDYQVFVYRGPQP